MQAAKCQLPGVLVFQPPTVFEDFRGVYVETYNERAYREAGVPVSFVQDDISVSLRHVLRGIHGDHTTWKLISCLSGKFYLVVVNCKEGTSQFGQWEAFLLSDRNHRQVLIPPHYGNAHLVLSDEAIFQYKQSSYYERSSQFTFAWNDPRFKIWWPIKSPIISQRDEGRTDA